MKHAFTLVHHIGEDGEAVEGRIFETTNSRFDDLEGRGIVREATAEEVAAGFQPAFEKDNTTASEVAGSEKQGEGEKEAPAPENKKAREPANKARG